MSHYPLHSSWRLDRRFERRGTRFGDPYRLTPQNALGAYLSGLAIGWLLILVLALILASLGLWLT
jgi:hypothetical protein